jgi:hypothetical protein
MYPRLSVPTGQRYWQAACCFGEGSFRGTISMDWTGHCLTQTLQPMHLSLSTSMPNGLVTTGGSLTYLNLLGLKDPDIPYTPFLDSFSRNNFREIMLLIIPICISNAAFLIRPFSALGQLMNRPEKPDRKCLKLSRKDG